jgi:hypothetical protein
LSELSGSLPPIQQLRQEMTGHPSGRPSPLGTQVLTHTSSGLQQSVTDTDRSHAAGLQLPDVTVDYPSQFADHVRDFNAYAYGDDLALQNFDSAGNHRTHPNFTAARETTSGRSTPTVGRPQDSSAVGGDVARDSNFGTGTVSQDNTDMSHDIRQLNPPEPKLDHYDWQTEEGTALYNDDRQAHAEMSEGRVPSQSFAGLTGVANATAWSQRIRERHQRGEAGLLPHQNGGQNVLEHDMGDNTSLNVTHTMPSDSRFHLFELNHLNHASSNSSLLATATMTEDGVIGNTDIYAGTLNTRLTSANQLKAFELFGQHISNTAAKLGFPVPKFPPYLAHYDRLIKFDNGAGAVADPAAREAATALHVNDALADPSTPAPTEAPIEGITATDANRSNRYRNVVDSSFDNESDALRARLDESLPDSVTNGGFDPLSGHHVLSVEARQAHQLLEKHPVSMNTEDLVPALTTSSNGKNPRYSTFRNEEDKEKAQQDYRLDSRDNGGFSLNGHHVLSLEGQHDYTTRHSLLGGEDTALPENMDYGLVRTGSSYTDTRTIKPIASTFSSLEDFTKAQTDYEYGNIRNGGFASNGHHILSKEGREQYEQDIASGDRFISNSGHEPQRSDFINNEDFNKAHEDWGLDSTDNGGFTADGHHVLSRTGSQQLAVRQTARSIPMPTTLDALEEWHRAISRGHSPQNGAFDNDGKYYDPTALNYHLRDNGMDLSNFNPAMSNLNDVYQSLRRNGEWKAVEKNKDWLSTNASESTKRDMDLYIESGKQDEVHSFLTSGRETEYLTPERAQRALNDYHTRNRFRSDFQQDPSWYDALITNVSSSPEFQSLLRKRKETDTKINEGIMQSMTTEGTDWDAIRRSLPEVSEDGSAHASVDSFEQMEAQRRLDNNLPITHESTARAAAEIFKDNMQQMAGTNYDTGKPAAFGDIGAWNLAKNFSETNLAKFPNLQSDFQPFVDAEQEAQIKKVPDNDPFKFRKDSASKSENLFEKLDSQPYHYRILSGTYSANHGEGNGYGIFAYHNSDPSTPLAHLSYNPWSNLPPEVSDFKTLGTISSMWAHESVRSGTVAMELYNRAQAHMQYLRGEPDAFLGGSTSTTEFSRRLIQNIARERGDRKGLIYYTSKINQLGGHREAIGNYDANPIDNETNYYEGCQKCGGAGKVAMSDYDIAEKTNGALTAEQFATARDLMGSRAQNHKPQKECDWCQGTGQDPFSSVTGGGLTSGGDHKIAVENLFHNPDPTLHPIPPHMQKSPEELAAQADKRRDFVANFLKRNPADQIEGYRSDDPFGYAALDEEFVKKEAARRREEAPDVSKMSLDELADAVSKIKERRMWEKAAEGDKAIENSKSSEGGVPWRVLHAHPMIVPVHPNNSTFDTDRDESRAKSDMQRNTTDYGGFDPETGHHVLSNEAKEAAHARDVKRLDSDALIREFATPEGETPNG